MNSVRNLVGRIFPKEGSSREYLGEKGNTSSSAAGEDKKPEILETIISKGEITVYDEEMNLGIVDGRYRFDIQKFSHLHLRARLPVTYKVVKTGNYYDWEVVEMSVHSSESNTPIHSDVSSETQAVNRDKEHTQILESESLESCGASSAGNEENCKPEDPGLQSIIL
ncbi:unnamed protein product [Allacma fusca]|uniref:Uncharacterized protein n=1 Tax=Allacma fusca TaxID=39272 RepID=A0A8J2P228_9HEXA|nr:unnamed protein product [Allacma fusca]